MVVDARDVRCSVLFLPRSVLQVGRSFTCCNICYFFLYSVPVLLPCHNHSYICNTMGRPFPLKIVHSHGEIWTTVQHVIAGPIPGNNPNDISIGLAVFAQLTAKCPFTLQLAAPSPVTIAAFHGASGPPCNTSSLRLPESST